MSDEKKKKERKFKGQLSSNIQIWKEMKKKKA